MGSDHREAIRQQNTLEKRLTPVHSFNDETMVFSPEDISTILGFERKSEVAPSSDVTVVDNFSIFMAELERRGMATPVFRRIELPQTDDSWKADTIHSSMENKYALLGYVFLDKFFQTDSNSNSDPLVADNFSVDGLKEGGRSSGANISEEDVIEKVSALRAHVATKNKASWQSHTQRDFLSYIYAGDDHRKENFLYGQSVQADQINEINEGLYSKLVDLNIIQPNGTLIANGDF